MIDHDDLETAVDQTKARYAAHLGTCPVCRAAVLARVYMGAFNGCPIFRDVREDADQAERRIIARNARAHGDLTHARRVEAVIAQVENERRRRIDA
jgi:hypothetical protein